MKRSYTFSPATTEAARLLGQRIQIGRRRRQMTAAELAERVGVSRGTIVKVERGDLTVSLGVALEAADVAGVPLLASDEGPRSADLDRSTLELAVLPRRVRRLRDPDDAS